jgi:hypothetical protein
MFWRAILIVLLFGCTLPQPAIAQALNKSDCGPPPQQFAESETSDTKAGGGFSGIFKQGAAKGDYQKAVTTTRQDVYSHYPNANELDRQQYADYVTCVLIVTDPDLSGEGRRKAWSEYLRSKGQPVPASAAAAPDIPQTADLIAGKWSGGAKDANGNSFQIEIDVKKSCALGEKCGSISVSHVPCHGDLFLQSVEKDGYEFRVDNFTKDSGHACTPGAGEHFSLLADGTLRYVTSYDPKATGILIRKE